MGLLDNTADRVSETLGRDPESAKGNAFNRDFNESDFDEFGATTRAGKFVALAAFEIPASTEYAWGYGRASNEANQGYIYVDLNGDDGTGSVTQEITGTLRLSQESATGRETLVVSDFALGKLDGSKTDRGLQIPLPEQVDKPTVSKDSSLVVSVRANEDGEDVTDEVSEVILPVTEYDLS